jgi:hypothetical protein
MTLTAMVDLLYQALVHRFAFHTVYKSSTACMVYIPGDSETFIGGLNGRLTLCQDIALILQNKFRESEQQYAIAMKLKADEDGFYAHLDVVPHRWK